MNHYAFVRTSRKGWPTLEFSHSAENVHQAIEKAGFYPYNLTEDWEESLDQVPMSKRMEAVYAYYGLVEGCDPYDYGNGPDGYGTVIIEWVAGGGVKMYPHDPNAQKLSDIMKTRPVTPPVEAKYKALVQTTGYPSDHYFTEPMTFEAIRDKYNLTIPEREELMENGHIRLRRELDWDKHPHHITITREPNGT